jgi:hypothetical protein
MSYCGISFPNNNRSYSRFVQVSIFFDWKPDILHLDSFSYLLNKHIREGHFIPLM